jgi:Aspartyl protease/PDZ domain
MIAATPAPVTCQAARELHAMRIAAGGSRWSDVAEIDMRGAATTSGLHGTAHFDEDLTRGRYARRFDISVMGENQEIFDGTTVWAKDISGGVHPYDAMFPRERAVTSAYLTERAYLDPHPTAAITCIGTRTAGDETFVVIRVLPQGGIPAELAVDARTHLLASIAERLPTTTGVTTYADYRDVDGIALPFSISDGTKGEPSDGSVVKVRNYRLLARVRADDFNKPVPSNDGTILGGAASTTVPLTLDFHQLLVWASIDGHPAMPFILDTGGHAILTAQAAKTLGLTGSGAGESGGSGSGTVALQYTRARSIQIGSAVIANQPMLVIPYDYSFYERGKKTPLAGILGLEVFERYTVRIDYGARTVTLSKFSNPQSGNGATLPLTFQEDMPMTTAAADGQPGLFGIDTGNSGSLILFGDYLRNSGLLARYSGGSLVIGHGTGGTNTGRLGMLKTMTLGGHDIHDLRTDFTQMTAGAFSSWTEAGNMGYAVMARFIPTFDYSRGLLYLQSQPHPAPMSYNATGMSFTKNAPDAFDVLAVTPGSLAATAGIHATDRIITINGKPASNYSWADLTTLLAQSLTDQVELEITPPSHKSSKKHVILSAAP